MDDSWEHAFMTAEDLEQHIKEHGMSGMKTFLTRRLSRWKDVEINIGVAGMVGVGKTSFINAIRGLADDDDFAAETGVTETTTEPTAYPHPTNPKIKFWDLPGIGTPNYPDIPTYCEKVDLKTFDTFLILNPGPFTQNDLDLATKVKDGDKSIFFIRTKVDADYIAQKRKRAFNEEVMLDQMKTECVKNLPANEEVFLISSLYPTKWEFPRLTQAILDALPSRQKECLTLSLRSLSTDMLKRKADILRGRIWMVASASAAAAVVPLPGLSLALDFTLIRNEVDLYKSQLGLPAEDSHEFRRMNPEIQQKIRKFCGFTSSIQQASFISAYVGMSTMEEFARFFPLIGTIAGGISFSSTYYFLSDCLNELEKTALELLNETTARAVDDLKIG